MPIQARRDPGYQAAWMPIFSERSGFSREPNAIAQALAELRTEGRAVLDLTVSNPTLAGLTLDAEERRAALAPVGSNVYRPEPLGLEMARAAVRTELERDGLSTSVEQMVLTSSTSEAYGYAFKLLCDAGQSVLVPQPSYP